MPWATPRFSAMSSIETREKKAWQTERKEREWEGRKGEKSAIPFTSAKLFCFGKPVVSHKGSGAHRINNIRALNPRYFRT